MKQIQVGGEVIGFPDNMSDAEIEKVLREQYKPQPSAAQKRIDAMPAGAQGLAAVGEAGLQAASGLGSSVLGGLAGLGDAALSLSGSPGDTVRKIQEWGTYKPRTSQGQTASRIAGYPMELYSKAVGAAADAVRGGDAGGVRDFAGTTLGVGLESLPVVLGGLSALKSARKPGAPLSPEQEILSKVQADGLTVPPSLVGKRSWLEGIGGKARTAQEHSANNAAVITELTPTELGMPKGTRLSPKVLQDYRDSLYREGYVPLKQKDAPLILDKEYYAKVQAPLDEINRVRGSFREAKIPGAAEIESLTDGLKNARTVTYEAAMERIKQLRSDADRHFKSMEGKAVNQRLAHAEKNAADALEGAIERGLQASGDEAMMVKFRMAREYIAKSHTIEDAINPATGKVHLRDLANSDAPMTGKLADWRDFGRTFERASQRTESFGGVLPASPLDASMAQITGIAGAAATGSPAGLLMGGVPLLRPYAAPMTMRPGVQQSLLRNPGPLPGELGALPLLADPALERKRRSLLP